MKKLLSFALTLFLLLSAAPAHSFAADGIKTAWLGELETLACWNAHQNKMDKDLVFGMTLYPTGKRLADSYNSWDVAACGLFPAFDAIIKNEAVIIGLGTDETVGNTLFAKQDSNILTAKGINAEYPEVFGSPETVRGKTILCTFNSNAHMLVLTWLNIIGLSDQDVRLVDVKPEEAFSAFKNGMGDILALWAPDTYLALDNNFVPIAEAKNCKINFLTVLLANKVFYEQHPEKVKEFLAIYYENAELLNKMEQAELAELYSNFLWSFANTDLSAEDAQKITQCQKIFTKSEIINFLNDEQNSFISKNIKNAAEYYCQFNAVSRADKEYLLKLSYFKNLLQ